MNFLILALLLLSSLSLVASECCGPFLGGWFRCEDGTSSGGGCCGKGKCNMACCNCDGGCRVAADYNQCADYCDYEKNICENRCEPCSIMGCMTCNIACSHVSAKCKKECEQRYPSSRVSSYLDSYIHPAQRIFDAVDVDKDGRITQSEFNSMAENRNVGPDEFNKLDRDNKGYLLPGDIDQDVRTVKH